VNQVLLAWLEFADGLDDHDYGVIMAYDGAGVQMPTHSAAGGPARS
jgi:hypothetical protein